MSSEGRNTCLLYPATKALDVSADAAACSSEDRSNRKTSFLMNAERRGLHIPDVVGTEVEFTAWLAGPSNNLYTLFYTLSQS